MKILEVLTYYRPWTSGLTKYVEWLSKAFVRQGNEVTVLTSRYDSSLPLFDVTDGVKIVRVPVLWRISKGVVMPGFGPMAWKLARQNDVIHLHLPQFDAPGVALRGRILGKPVVLTYHCDLRLPDSALNRVADRVVLLMNQMAGTLANAIVAYTHDYATHSPYLSRFVDRKLRVIPPPVELASCSKSDKQRFREKYGLQQHKVIGISARLAAEKGVEVLLKALPRVLEAHPDVIVLHAGIFENVLGEETYAARLAPMLKQFEQRYIFVGNLNGAEYAAFHQNLDCLVMCSLNSTESFGLVQIEAMMSGTPVAACGLPGVRQPVSMTGMGEITPVADPKALSDAVIRILDDKHRYVRDAGIIADCFAPDQCARDYVDLFTELQEGRFEPQAPEPGAYRRLRKLKDHPS